jgi:two-component system nitrate/nitrite response regulator NarL
VKRKINLSPREIQVARLIADGLTNKAIGVALFISEETVKSHLKNVFDKTGMSSRLELAVFMHRHGDRFAPFP